MRRQLLVPLAFASLLVACAGDSDKSGTSEERDGSAELERDASSPAETEYDGSPTRPARDGGDGGSPGDASATSGHDAGAPGP